MLVILLRVMSVIFLHTFDVFFRLDLIAEHVHQLDDDHVFVGNIFERVVNPLIRLAAHVNENVALRNFADIFDRRLEAVQVNALVHEQSQIEVFISADNLSRPIVNRKNCRDDFNFIVLHGF